MYETHEQSMIYDQRINHGGELNTTRDVNKYISGIADESLISNFRKTEGDFD